MFTLNFPVTDLQKLTF